jgi:hypothetical protein
LEINLYFFNLDRRGVRFNFRDFKPKKAHNRYFFASPHTLKFLLCFHFKISYSIPSNGHCQAVSMLFHYNFASNQNLNYRFYPTRKPLEFPLELSKIHMENLRVHRVLKIQSREQRCMLNKVYTVYLHWIFKFSFVLDPKIIKNKINDQK